MQIMQVRSWTCFHDEAIQGFVCITCVTEGRNHHQTGVNQPVLIACFVGPMKKHFLGPIETTLKPRKADHVHPRRINIKSSQRSPLRSTLNKWRYTRDYNAVHLIPFPPSRVAPSLVNTNDAFVGIDSESLVTSGASKSFPPAYDAGE